RSVRPALPPAPADWSRGHRRRGTRRSTRCPPRLGPRGAVWASGGRPGSGSLATYEWEPEQTGRRGGDGERAAELPLVERLGRTCDRGIVGAGHEPDHVLIAGHPRREEAGARRRNPDHSAA